MPHNAFKTLKDFKMESGKTGKLYSLPALARKFPMSTVCQCRSALCLSRCCVM